MIAFWIVCITINFIALGIDAALDKKKKQNYDLDTIIFGFVVFAPITSMIVIGYGIGKLIKAIGEVHD